MSNFVKNFKEIMDTPFVYGRLATEADFTDRQEETEHLVNNFTSLINTIIISPRCWGKSSLVNKAANVAMVRDQRLRVAQVDLFNVLDEQQLYKALSEAIIHATSTATMAKQGITSATAAYRSKKALIERDILDDIGGSTTFVDPIYAYWLRHTFFK